MKEMLNKYGFLIVCLFVRIELVAQITPPPGLPTPPPPGLPIDEGLLVLLVIGLLFGFYKIYLSIQKKKRSI
jgi:hypothetical protein